MAGPTVTLTFAGDEQKLTKAMSNVGSSADQMAKKVGDASRSFDQTSSASDALMDSADTTETRFQGLSDTVSGVTDTFSAFTDESLSTGEKLMALGTGGSLRMRRTGREPPN